MDNLVFKIWNKNKEKWAEYNYRYYIHATGSLNYYDCFEVMEGCNESNYDIIWGLKIDKKEYYEGDIIKVIDDMGTMYFLGIILFQNGCFTIISNTSENTHGTKYIKNNNVFSTRSVFDNYNIKSIEDLHKNIEKIADKVSYDFNNK